MKSEHIRTGDQYVNKDNNQTRTVVAVGKLVKNSSEDYVMLRCDKGTSDIVKCCWFEQFYEPLNW